MDMHLDDLVVVHQYEAVAQLGQERPEILRVMVIFPGNNELGAVGEGDVLGIEVGEVRALLGLRHRAVLGQHHVLALQGAEHGFQRYDPALAAGVHNTGLFQHGVLVDGIGQRLHGFLNGCFVDEFDKVVLPGGVGSLGRGQAGDGEDGAFGGLHDGLVSGVNAFLQRLRPQNAVAFLAALQALGNAPEQQRQNDAGIAPCAPQHGGSRHLGRFFQIGVLGLAQVGGRGVDGHGHIGAGISIRHGEHVQLVESLLVDLDGGSRADDHSAKIGSVDGFSQFISLRTLTDHHGIDINIYGPNLGAGAVGHHIANLGNNGSAHGVQVYVVVHDNMQINGNGVVLVELDMHALAHGFPAEQMVQAVGQAPGSHALDAKAVDDSGADNVRVDAGADIDASVFIFVTDHRCNLQFSVRILTKGSYKRLKPCCLPSSRGRSDPSS